MSLQMSSEVQRKTLIIASSCQVVGGAFCYLRGNSRIGVALIGGGFFSGIKAFSETAYTIRDYARQTILSLASGLVSGWCGDGVVRLLHQSAKPIVIATVAQVTRGVG